MTSTNVVALKTPTTAMPVLAEVAAWLVDVGFPAEVTFDPRPPSALEREVVAVIADHHGLDLDSAWGYYLAEAGYSDSHPAR